MSFVAEASRTLGVPPEVAFDRLADHPSWKEWMPRSFTPLSPARGALRVGDRLRMRIARAPFPAVIEVTVVERAKEIAWRGGVAGVLHAEHRFLFESDGKGGTRVRSVETWRGALAAVLRRFVRPVAERIGAEQLDGLARGVGSPTP
jgi:hypothetical protein